MLAVSRKLQPFSDVESESEVEVTEAAATVEPIMKNLKENAITVSKKPEEPVVETIQEQISKVTKSFHEGQPQHHLEPDKENKGQKIIVQEKVEKVVKRLAVFSPPPPVVSNLKKKAGGDTVTKSKPSPRPRKSLQKVKRLEFCAPTKTQPKITDFFSGR
jgi:hypothetical protein